MPLNEFFFNELKTKTDIEDVVSQYVQLKRRGSTLVGLCPFHSEKTPSFTVYPKTQSFYCFGCGAGGDAVTFIKNIEHLDYIDAVKFLADKAGLQMPDTNFDDTLSKTKRKIYEINRLAAKFFHACLYDKNSKIAQEYYKNRNISESTITKFGLGYAPDSWDSLYKFLISKGYKSFDIEQAGLVKKNRYGKYFDIFRNRVITPIIDIRGNVVAFGGRVLDDSKPKYINTADTLVYKKTNELFSLNFAKENIKSSIILCEGYMDVISMYQAGIKNAIAGCGTALTTEQVRVISRYADEVVLIYDSDEAGQKALKKAISLFNQTNVNVRIPKLFGGKDPDEIINKLGPDRFMGMIEKSANEIEYKLNSAKSNYNTQTSSGKVEYIGEAIKILSDFSPVEQDIYVSQIADELSVSKETINAQLKEYLKNKNRKKEKNQFKNIIDQSINDNFKESVKANETVKTLKAQERLIALLFLYPDCVKMLDDFDCDELQSGFFKTVFSLMKQRLNNSLEIDVSSMSQHLTQDELAKYTKIIACSTVSNNSKQEFAECINTVQKEISKKQKKDVDYISDDDFRKLFGNNT